VISQEPGPGEPGPVGDGDDLYDVTSTHDPNDPAGATGTDDELVQADQQGTRPRKVGRAVREWVLVIGGALVVALLIRTFLFQAYEIPSPSMVDTLKVGDRVLVNKLSYKLHDIHRGDVVVFKRPPGEPDPAIKDLIKRVVGLPGETLTFKDCQVFVGGKALVEPYADGQCTDPPQSNIDPDGDGIITVPSKMLFVMGDNRGGSFDSRYFGPITESSVVGRAFVIMWPIGDWAWL
jgi:signal peptidase I